MKPVLIFRHIACEGPAYLARFLEKRGLEYRVIKIDEGETVPSGLENISALVFMGGPMSVNDELPWIQAELELIRRARDLRIPVLGHCLGGQLISKALGGTVTPSEQEFGWFPLEPYDSVRTPEWLRELDFSTDIFHWHGEQFSLPDGSIPLFSSGACKNQGFILDSMMALQCHVEIERDDITVWTDYYKNEIPQSGKFVQSADEMCRDLPARIERLQEFADTLYNHWLTPE